MPKKNYLPNIDQLSLLSVVILLAYLLLGIIILPSRGDSTQSLWGIFGSSVDPNFLYGLIVAGLTAAGTNWLVRGHPLFRDTFSIQHWLLPALSSWIIGLILFQQPINTIWWLIISIGVPILILIIIAEFVIVDPEGDYHSIAAISLTAISYALFLTLAIIIKGINFKSTVIIPTMAIASGLTSLRTLHLQWENWYFAYALIIAIIVGELSSPLYFFDFDPVVFGLLLLGFTYAITSLVSGLLRNRPVRQIILEPIIVLLIVWGIAILL